MANTTKSLLPMYFERGRSGIDLVRYPQLNYITLHVPCITLDSYLNFNDHDHVYTLTSSLLSTLYQLSRVRHLFTKSVLSTILNSLIFSKPFYCSTVWAGSSKQNLQKLQYYQCKTSPPAY